MRVAAWQFPGSDDTVANAQAVLRGVAAAREAQARVVLTQECALTGYPPLEREAGAALDYAALRALEAAIGEEAEAAGILVALGTEIERRGKPVNALRLLGAGAESLSPYAKRALWGWDADRYAAGSSLGTFEVDGVTLGARICYEVRFPEYFRELFEADASIALVAFCDVGEGATDARYDLLRAHLMTRAVENAMWVVSANSSSARQGAPTAAIDPDGAIVAQAPREGEALLCVEASTVEPSFGRRGRIQHSRGLLRAIRG